MHRYSYRILWLNDKGAVRTVKYVAQLSKSIHYWISVLCEVRVSRKFYFAYKHLSKVYLSSAPCMQLPNVKPKIAKLSNVQTKLPDSENHIIPYGTNSYQYLYSSELQILKNNVKFC